MSKASIFLKLLFLSILLSSCSRDLFISPSYTTAFKNLTESFFGNELSITKELVDSIPFASSIISFKGSQSLIILESIKNNTNIWVSADRKIFYTKEGRVISTIGLPNNLYKIQMPNISFQDISKKGYVEYFAYYSFRNPKFDNLKVQVNSKVIKKERVDLLDRNIEVFFIEESLYSKKINWRVKNKYWVDSNTYFLWKSEQNITPNLPPLSMEVTKKPTS